MAVWLIRAGSHGEFEQKFLQEGRVYVTWDDLAIDLSALSQKQALKAELEKIYTDSKPKRILNWVSQIWPFAHEMKQGDLVVLPLKTQPLIYIGEVVGDYQAAPEGPNPFYHWRAVKWIGEAIPRTHFGEDLLFTFGAFLTICRVQRNNAEQRIQAMRANGWQAETRAAVVQAKVPAAGGASSEVNDEELDLEELAQDQISRLIAARFKGHGLTRLVEAILRAKGYTTYMSPEGPDGGADILAGSGPLGFGAPRLCVEVKSGSTPIDRPTVDKLLGAMTKFNADEGLFVAWGGYKGNVQKELSAQFFRLRLWTQREVMAQLFECYEHLDEEIKAELPLKRVWMVTTQDSA